ncbi:MAG: NAD(P)H-dependent oxidoreductase [Myxococcales bacterium]|nr:NAD(P)H-dependent oxidoreductase [Myxococcales bacterium]
MSASPRILAFAGSARRESFNKRLVRVAAAGAEAAGVGCTVIDLRDHPLPIYDADLEAESGLPENASVLRELFRSHQALLIASPEYNSSISPLLKNTIDWVSRSEEGGGDLGPYRDKLAAILAASPGALGGLRGLVTLRSLLGNIGCTVIADQLTVRQADQAFAPDGSFVDPKQQARVEALGAELARWVLRAAAG